MTFDDFRDADFSDLGSAPAAVRRVLLAVALALVLLAGYFLFIGAKSDELTQARLQELTLMTDFETKQAKAANLEAIQRQLEEMQSLLQTMFRQLPGKTEMDKLLVDVSQTALASGIEVQLFEPQPESFKGFYAERPINIRMLGKYHQFGQFVSGVAALPRVVILTMHDISLRRAAVDLSGTADTEERLILEGTVKTYRYVDEGEVAQREVAQVQ